jgi:CheY-like chemotaxis protein
MVRATAPISEIRVFLRNRGGYLISDPVLEKVRNLPFSVKDAYEKVLVEETALGKKAPAATGKAAAAAPAPEQPPSILVVEDDEDNRNLIVRYLEGQGYRMATAADGVDALLSLGQHAYDLVLSDVNMPNLDGFKLLELIQQKGISTPVVLLTARTGTDDEVRGFELGAADYIKKPISKDVLLLRVRKILGKKT